MLSHAPSQRQEQGACRDGQAADQGLYRVLQAIPENNARLGR